MTDSFAQRERVQLYISVLGIDRQRMKPRGSAFVATLEQHGFSVFMPFEWRDYHIIEREIDQSDALIALADMDWYSSTWKASEVTYALAGCGAFQVVHDHLPIPTFIFWNEEPFEIRYLQGDLKNHSGLFYLPWDITQATDTICDFFSCKYSVNPIQRG